MKLIVILRKQKENAFCFLLYYKTFKCLYLWNELIQFSWGFQLKVTSKIPDTTIYTARLLWPAMWYPITQLLHWYLQCTLKITVLLLWSSSNATLEYPCRYSNRVDVWVLHGNSRVTSQEQVTSLYRYQCSNCVIGYHIAGHSNFVV